MGKFNSRPQIEIIGDGRVELIKSFSFTSDSRWWSPKFQRYESEIVAPKGFVCDLASVPKVLAALAPSWNQTAGAGIVHDLLYRTGALTRWDADAILYEALRAAPSTGRVRATAMWAFVRVFGWAAWTCNRLSEVG